MSKLRHLALPLTPLFAAAVRARAAAYRRGWKKTHHFPVPVVSVGNLTFGGTGKTPTVIALVRDLIQHGRRPAILTRGYGRDTDLPLLLVGPDPREGPALAGDEPLELASRLPGVPIVVDADRIRGGDRALQLGVDVLVLDDGFQHLRVSRNFDLVLLDNGDPWGGGRLPPRGRLREPLIALQRASAALVTKLPPTATTPPPEIEHRVRKLAPGVPVFGARLVLHRLRTRDGDRAPSALYGRRVFAVAGVGRPGGFLDLLVEFGAQVAGHRWFADHHPFEPGDVQSVLEQSRRLDATVVTTAKDAVKLPKEMGAWTIEITMQPLAGSWDQLWELTPEILG